MKSPRFKWMEKYHVTVKQTPNWSPGQEDENGDEVCKFYATDDNIHYHGGNTLDNALAEWAEARGKLLWFEEGLA